MTSYRLGLTEKNADKSQPTIVMTWAKLEVILRSAWLRKCWPMLREEETCDNSRTFLTNMNSAARSVAARLGTNAHSLTACLVDAIRSVFRLFGAT
jgi:hypothetical protein